MYLYFITVAATERKDFFNLFSPMHIFLYPFGDDRDSVDREMLGFHSFLSCFSTISSPTHPCCQHTYFLFFSFNPPLSLPVSLCLSLSLSFIISPPLSPTGQEASHVLGLHRSRLQEGSGEEFLKSWLSVTRCLRVTAPRWFRSALSRPVDRGL